MIEVLKRGKEKSRIKQSLGKPKNKGVDIMGELFENKVSKTMLMTLQAKALEGRQKNRLFIDQKAEEMMKQVPSIVNISFFDQIGVCLRTKYFDDCCKNFIKTHEHPVIIQLGCGLDDRQGRIGAEDIPFFSVDFLDVITLRQEFFEETTTSQMIADSILDDKWIQIVKEQYPRGDYLFIIEGVLMYFKTNDIKELATKLEREFHQYECYFDTLQHHMIATKNKQKEFREQGVRMHWGLSSQEELYELFGKHAKIMKIDYTMAQYPNRWKVVHRIVSFIPFIQKAAILIQIGIFR